MEKHGLKLMAGNYIERLAADLDEFLDALDRMYDAIMDDELHVGTFYNLVGDSRNDSRKKIHGISKYLTHQGVDAEIKAEILNAVEAFERLGSMDKELKDEGYRGVYPTRQMDRLYMFAYSMVKDALERTDGFMQATPTTLAYMGIDIRILAK